MTSSTFPAPRECKYSKKCSRYDAESYTCTHGESDYCGHYKAIQGVKP